VTDEKNDEVVNEPAPEALSDAPADASTSDETPDAAPQAAAEDTTESSSEEVAASEEVREYIAPEVPSAPEVEHIGHAEVAEGTSGDTDDQSAAPPEPVVADSTEIIEGDVAYIEGTPSAGELAFIEETPREKPAIPGADLIPDIVAEGSDFLDAEARAAAEAEAEEAAARAAAEDPELAAKPIAEVAIDLAAGARYTATGKRKTGVARVILKPGTGVYLINGKTLEQFFPRETLQRVIRQPLEAVGYEARMDVTARMHGGGVSSQAGALRHGIARALLEADPNLRGELKRRGFLTRDPRVKERKKAGLKKARKRPQFSKR
jgi:small subunit ribosomal protein S9